MIPDDIHGYAALKAYGRIPIAGGEHELTLYGFRELLEAESRRLHPVRYQSGGRYHAGAQNLRPGGSALVPVVPHAGQMHNYHVVMANFNSPMAEFFPLVDVEVGNELFRYIFEGEPVPRTDFIELDENPRASD